MKAAQDPVRIGTTGHRILTDVHPVMAGVHEAIATIRSAYPGRPLTILSGLADGADRIVAEVVLEIQDSQLVAVLPFPEKEYAVDFGDDGSSSHIHFDALVERAAEVRVVPEATDRQEAYARAGELIVDQCDVLLAVWDGQAAQGRGGTAEMVARARAQGKPVVIVEAGNRRPGTEEPTTLGPCQGHVLVERL